MLTAENLIADTVPLAPLPSVSHLEARALLASFDFGDAPDNGPGTGTFDYNTLSSDNGPSHGVTLDLFMGATVDGETDGLRTGAANGDDVDQALPDDEDGLTNPLMDLQLTVGAAPAVNVIVTNNRGTDAKVVGWIDYNTDGVFDNNTEGTSVVVPTGTAGSVVTLQFPVVPLNASLGTTYARFRVSTDSAGFNPTGAALDGEVEDYVASITLPSESVVDSTIKIAHQTNGGPSLGNAGRVWQCRCKHRRRRW